MINKKGNLISIVGPTGIGKTSLSITLAKYFKTEILSADSRQFYKEMSIGTAVPTLNELAEVQHHFIHDRSIFQNFNVGDYEFEVLNRLDILFNQYPSLILVGGSGLYVDAVLLGLDDFPAIDPSIRINLLTELESKGIEPLQLELKRIDPITYQKVDLQNSQRVLRAIEIFRATNKPFSSFLGLKKQVRNFKTIQVGLTAEREIIYDRINRRVDLMMQDGLEKEVKGLFEERKLNALQTVGYKELFRYFENELTLQQAIEEIKKNSRRYAKRQLTWFKRDKNIKWFDYQSPKEDVIGYIESQF